MTSAAGARPVLVPALVGLVAVGVVVWFLAPSGPPAADDLEASADRREESAGGVEKVEPGMPAALLERVEPQSVSYGDGLSFDASWPGDVDVAGLFSALWAPSPSDLRQPPARTIEGPSWRTEVERFTEDASPADTIERFEVRLKKLGFRSARFDQDRRLRRLAFAVDEERLGLGTYEAYVHRGKTHAVVRRTAIELLKPEGSPVAKTIPSRRAQEALGAAEIQMPWGVRISDYSSHGSTTTVSGFAPRRIRKIKDWVKALGRRGAHVVTGEASRCRWVLAIGPKDTVVVLLAPLGSDGTAVQLFHTWHPFDVPAKEARRELAFLLDQGAALLDTGKADAAAIELRRSFAWGTHPHQTLLEAGIRQMQHEPELALRAYRAYLVDAVGIHGEESILGALQRSNRVPLMSHLLYIDRFGPRSRCRGELEHLALAGRFTDLGKLEKAAERCARGLDP